MSNQQLRHRLERAGIAFPVPTERGVFLVDLIPPYVWLAPSLRNPSQGGNISRRIAVILGTLLGGRSLPDDLLGSSTSGMYAMVQLPKEMTATALLLHVWAQNRERENNSSEIASMLSMLGDPLIRETLLPQVSSWNAENQSTLYDFLMFASVAKPEDAPQFLHLLRSEQDRLPFEVLAVLHELDVLESLVDSGELDNYIAGKNAELMHGLVSLAMSGSVDSFSDNFGDLDWETKISILRMIRAVGQKNPDPLLLEFLGSCLGSVSDSDALIWWCWAASSLVSKLELEAAEEMVSVAEQQQNGSYDQSMALQSLFSFAGSPEEKERLMERVLQVSSTDSDTRQTMQRIVSRLHGIELPAEQVNGYGYGRLEYLFAPHSPSLKALREKYLGNGEESRGLRRMLAQRPERFSDEGRGLIIASLMNTPEDIASAARLVRESNTHTATRKYLAASLLAHPESPEISPILLRCLLGKELGGNVQETPENLGELLGLLTDSDCREAAGAILASGSAMARHLLAGYTQIISDSDDFFSTLRLQSGVVLPGLQNISLSMAPNAESRNLQALFTEHGPGSLRSLMENTDMNTIRGMFRNPNTFRELSLLQCQLLWLSFSRSNSWQEREAACILVQTLGPTWTEESLLLNDLPKRLPELCRDGDNDVKREAKKACEVLGIAIEETEEEESEDDDLPF